MRKGSESELVSNFTRTHVSGPEIQAGHRAGKDGQPMASLEVVTVINLPSASNPGRHQRHAARPDAGGHRRCGTA